MRVILSRFALAVAALVTASGVPLPARQPAPTRWPPGVLAVQDGAPVRSPDDERATFVVAPGHRVELIASEPLVRDPIAVDWDPAGRLWVVEMPGYMPDITASTEHAPVGRVVVLEDADGDGRMDRRTVFADGLVLARSVKVVEAGVLVAEPPHLWLMRDTNGDLRADAKVAVTDQFGRREIDVQNNANGLDWGIDNRVRTAGQSRLHLRWTTGTFVADASPARGQWGVTHDDAGRTYRNTNESALHVDLVPGEYYARTPNLLRTRGSYERLATDANALNVVWPIRPTPGVNRGYQAGIRRADGTLARYTAVCSPVIYRGDRMPDAQGNAFVADPAGNLVSRLVLEEDASGDVRARKAYPDAEFLASTDERFRPVFLSNAPDGTLTVVDMYRGVIEHRLSLTQYLRAYVEQHGLLQPRGLGRIWRVSHAATPRDTTPIATGVWPDLLAMLSHPNGWRRDTAQRLIVERGETPAAPEIERLVHDAADARVRLQALWTLDGIDRVTPAIVARALADPSPHVQAAALRVGERWATLHTADVRRWLATALKRDDQIVRRQAAASLGALPRSPGTWEMAADVLTTTDDPVVIDAVLSGLRGAEAEVLARVVDRAADARPRSAPSPADMDRPPTPSLAIATTAATVFHVGQEATARRWLNRAADARTPLQIREALMHGAEVGLLGAPMPGLLAPLANPALACPTCPGGRLSAGGAYAFTDPATFARTPTAGRTLRLTRAPDLFVALAAAPTRLGRQAATVLTRLTWPGKPGDDDAPPPLTVAEQRRFEAGREVYRAMCEACHDTDGRGAPGRGAALVGSPLATAAAADVPVRVLLQGKEGRTGLMPPIGATMSDDQIARVLTYVRREWGHGAAAVDAATVARIRARTRNRTRPWTDAELMPAR